MPGTNRSALLKLSRLSNYLNLSTALKPEPVDGAVSGTIGPQCASACRARRAALRGT